MMRSTESFFTDYTTETKRISLTPSLLRDDSNSQTSVETGSSRPERMLNWHDKKKTQQADRKTKKIRSLFSVRRRDSGTEYPVELLDVAQS